MAKTKRVKGEKKQAPAKQPSASQELNDEDLDKVAGGLGYGGKLQLSPTTVTDTTVTTVTDTTSLTTIKTSLGYGG
jgi:hypothetical protein